MSHAPARRMLRVPIAFLALLVLAKPALPQAVELASEGDPRLDRAIRQVLAGGDFRLIASDTVLQAGDTVPGDLLILRSRVVLEAAVLGNLVAVDANVYLRPAARIRGDVVNVAGGVYRSELAEIGGEIVDAPVADYRVEATPTGYSIFGRSGFQALRLDNGFGLQVPTYDRVDGLGLSAGATYRFLTAGRAQPYLRGEIGYRVARQALTGMVGAGVDVDSLYGILIGAQRETATNEAWIRSDFVNSLAYAFNGKDHRNYYDARRAFVEGYRRHAAGPWVLTAILRGQLERGRSLTAHDLWTLREPDSIRPNPDIALGEIASAILTGSVLWVGATSALETGLSVEVAPRVFGGDHRFERYLHWGEWSMQAFADHVLAVEWRLQGPLPGTQSLPRQRWSFVGGGGTLPTYGIADFQGDRLAFVESEYILPLPDRWRLPVLGRPYLEFVHAAGMAWTADAAPDLEQNIGARLRFFLVYLRAMTNPADARNEFDVDVGVSLPFGGGYPWQRP